MAAGRARREVAARRRRVSQRRRAAARRARVRAIRRCRIRTARIDPARDAPADRRRIDPRGSRRRRTAARASRKRSEEDAVGRSQGRTGTAAARPRARWIAGRALRTLGLSPDDARRLRGFQFLSAKPLLARDQSRRSAIVACADHAGGASGHGRVCCRTRSAAIVGVCAKIELEIAQLDRGGCRGVHGRSRLQAIRPRSRDPRRVRSARLHVVLHRRRGRMPRLVDSATDAGARTPPARFTPTSSADSSARKSCPATRCSRAARSRRAAITASCGSRARTTSSRTAT